MPVLAGCPATSLNLGCNPTSIPTCTSYNVTATDDCSTPTVTCGSLQVTNGCVITRTLTWTATDNCGHSASCSQAINWTADSTKPAFTGCPATTLDKGCNPDLTTIPTCASYNVTATDGCSTPNVTCAALTVTNGCLRTRTLTCSGISVPNSFSTARGSRTTRRR